MRQSSGKSFDEFMTLLSYQMLQRWEYLPHKPVGEKRNGIEAIRRRRRGQTWVSSDSEGPVLLISCNPDLVKSIGHKGGGVTFSNPSPLLGLPQVISDREPEKMNPFLKLHNKIYQSIHKKYICNRLDHVLKCWF